MGGEIGSEVSRDQHALPVKRRELLLGGGECDRPIDGLELYKKLVSLSVFRDLDHRVGARALRDSRLPSDDRSLQPGGTLQCGQRILQDLPVLCAQSPGPLHGCLSVHNELLFT